MVVVESQWRECVGRRVSGVSYAVERKRERERERERVRETEINRERERERERDREKEYVCMQVILKVNLAVSLC